MLLTTLLLLSVLFIVVSTTRYKLHPFLALLAAAVGFGLAAGMPFADIVNSVQDGFGSTLGKIGIVIIAGTLIGVFLENSGGAFAMAESILKLIGRKRVPAAMSVIGYVTSIPVFGDSGFVIFSPLNRALTKRAGLSLATTAIALCLGLMVSHTLIPPTPGPIAAAALMRADLGRVILIAVPVSLCVLAFSWFWATRVASRTYIDPEPDLTDADIELRLRHAPSASLSFLPILAPLALIVLASIAAYPTRPFGTGQAAVFLEFVGSPFIALFVGVLLAFLLPRKFDRELLSQTGWVGKGLQAAAIIIFITGAGGAFGRILQNSGFAGMIGEALAPYSLGLWLPFILCAAIRAAQGSATVAIITTAGIVEAILPALGLDSDIGRALSVVAICSGGFFASHANDSFFWVVTQMSGMTAKDGYRLLTLGSTLMSFLSGALVWTAGLILL